MDRMLRDKKTIILFMAPAILIFTLVIPIPLAASIGLSFFKWDLLSNAKFVGVKILSGFLHRTGFSGQRSEILFPICCCPCSSRSHLHIV